MKGLFLLVLCLTSLVAVNPGIVFAHEIADVFYSGGTILPMEPFHGCSAQQRGIATKGDTILWIGCINHVPRIIGPDTRYVDLAGRALLPGLVDAHSHMFGDAADLADFQARQALVLRNGITSQGELFANQNTLDGLISYRDAGEIKVRTSLYLRWNNACGTVSDEWWKAYQPIHNVKVKLRMPGIKIYSDGGSCSDAAISFPYADGTYGDLYLTPDQLAPMIQEANDLGWQVAIHSLGDVSRDQVLEALKHTHRKPGVPRTRIEHDTIIRPDQLVRYSKVHAIPVVFGNYSTCNELNPGPDFSWHGIIPPSFFGWYRPLRDLIAANPHVPIAWSLDKDGTVADGGGRPMHGTETIDSLYGLVTRREVDDDGTICQPAPDMVAQSITVEQALRIMTKNAAIALGADSMVGSLKRGKFADFVILSSDPVTADPATLKDLAVSATILGGEPLYCAAGSEDLCTP